MKRIFLILTICGFIFSCKNENNERNKTVLTETNKTNLKSEFDDYIIECKNRAAKYKVEWLWGKTFNVYSNVSLDRGNIRGIVNVPGVSLLGAMEYEFSFVIGEMFDEKEVYNIMIQRIEDLYCNKGWK